MVVEIFPEEVERTILVSGLPAAAEDDDIMGIFENRRKNGGPIEKLRRIIPSQALITYKDKNGKLNYTYLHVCCDVIVCVIYCLLC